MLIQTQVNSSNYFHNSFSTETEKNTGAQSSVGLCRQLGIRKRTRGINASLVSVGESW